MIPIVIALARVGAVNSTVRGAVIAAINELQRRGLTAIDMNQLREALIATGNNGIIAKWFGHIAEKLF